MSAKKSSMRKGSNMVATAPRIFFSKLFECQCEVLKMAYGNGRAAIQLSDPETSEPICTASVNVPDIDVPEGHTFIKNYSENEGVLEELIEHCIIEKPIQMISNGFVDIPLCKVLI